MGPKHSHTPIPDPLSPMAQTQTPTPKTFHLFPPIFTDHKEWVGVRSEYFVMIHYGSHGVSS